MKSELVKLSQVSQNDKNPRKITDSNLSKLVNSILVFPGMLLIRPVVVDEAMNTLGGNMRIRAMQEISTLSIHDIEKRLEGMLDYKKKTKKKQAELLSYWKEWLTEPTISIVKAGYLTQEEKEQFLLKDNVGFGEFDMQRLKSWDNAAFQQWGLNVNFDDSVLDSVTEAESVGNKQESAIPQEALPEELQGIDVTPEALPKLQGDGETKNEYISISYTEEYAPVLCAEIIGISEEKLFSKIVWNVNELVQLKYN